MGYLISYRFHQVRILATHVEAALAAIHLLYQPETIERWGTGMTFDRTTRTTKPCYRSASLPPDGGFATLIDALRSWSLQAVQQPNGDVEIVEYLADKAGDEAVLFAAISPYLDQSDRPKIDAFQDNQQYWRHTFAGGQHRQVCGKVVYADEHPQLFDRAERFDETETASD
ncbi:hypothetical protein H6F67_25620 [Microcoleus sp. FACHB-1515]|uniref:hypothetical protein n=1 Tax=Cyanophyceae TaxID=3028117 RepID=UPI0016822EC9|nr:hypothetical protein [Microcoleus sp. FACHB-1515]MBD2093227.1 hypothetical protein [Microcoleus sp. FACHB-1515]